MRTNTDRLGKSWLVILLISCCTLPAHAYEFAGGTGEPNDPYQITTAEQLISIGSDPDLLDRHFVLLNDIDLDPDLPDGQIFDRALIAPDMDPADGFQGEPFAGTLDGAGLSISNPTVHGNSHLGLFGLIGAGAEVRNVRIVDANVMGQINSDCVGGLAAENEGSITDCSVSMTATGTYGIGGLVGINADSGVITGCRAVSDVVGEIHRYVGFVGGLVGMNAGKIINSCAHGGLTGGYYVGGLVGRNPGEISACFATGQVTGYDYFGGLVGSSRGTIRSSYAIVNVYGGDAFYYAALAGDNNGKIVNCYAVGIVLNVAYPEDSYFGGLIGGSPIDVSGGTVVNCFWNTDVSAVYISQGGGMGLTTSQMMDPGVYSLNGWGGDPNWALDAGKDYPRLAWEATHGQPISQPVIDWFEGGGTEDDPYVISTAEQLACIGTASILWNRAFVLASDVNVAGIDFPRIGICRGTAFTGTFDGGGHVIGNLRIDTNEIPEVSNIGMFGWIGPRGLVHHLALDNASIACGWGSDRVGILAGVNEGTVADCSTSGRVSGGDWSWFLGQVVGYNTGSVESCSSTATVSAGAHSGYIGGLVGR